MIFEVVPGTNILRRHVIKERVKPNKRNKSTAFIECHLYDNASIKNLNKNMIVAVGTKDNNTKKLTWRLGIISSLAVRTHTTSDPNEEKYDGMLSVFIWSGECHTMEDGSAFPALFLKGSCHHAMEHLTLKHIKFNKRSGLKVKALNQWNGFRPNGKFDYAMGIINEEDGCLQCSYGGPDKYELPLPHTQIPSSFFTKYDKVPTEIPSTYKRYTHGNNRKKHVKAANVRGEKDIAFINRAPNFTPPSNSTVTAVIVTDSHNNPLSLKDVSSIKDEWEGFYFVPSPTDCVSEKIFQKVYLVNLEQSKILKKMNGVNILEVEDVLRDNSKACINTICVNTNNELPPFSQVFAGKSSPPTSSGKFVERKLPGLNRTVHFAVVDPRDIDKYTPLHTSLVDNVSHHHKLNYQEVNILKNAFGTNGQFPNRFVVPLKKGETGPRETGPACQGHQTFLGKRTNTSRCGPTPGEGPRVKEKFNLYRATTNVLYLPGATHILNTLANQIFRVPSILYRALTCLLICGNPGNGFISICRIAILTINFYNKCHIDRGDALSVEKKQYYLDKAKHIRDSPLTIQSEQDRMDYFIKFIEDFGISVPTTCGIQFIRTAKGLANPKSNIIVCQVFLMLGLGLSLRMCNYMTHVFMGRVFSHCTCMPIIVVDGKAYFGSHPYIDIVSWGASGSGNITEREHVIATTRDRNNRNRARDRRRSNRGGRRR